jgi:Nuclease A inhibitor-like protein
MKQHPAVQALKQAAKGLTFVSETDAKLEPFLWEGGGELDEKRIRELAGAEADAAVESMSVADFFRAVPPENRAKFDKLVNVLQEQLSCVKVYKVGDEAEKQAYIVATTGDGQWAGLKTTVVEI